MTANTPDLFALRFKTRLSFPITTLKRPAAGEETVAAESLVLPGRGERRRIGILMVHGFTISPACFAEYARGLNESGYTVHVPRLPGHGGVPADLHGVSRFDWLERIRREYDVMRTHCDQICAVGISLGASLILRLSIERDLASAFLLAPLVYPIPILRVGRYILLPIMRSLGLKYWLHVAGDVNDPTGFELGYAKTSIHALRELYDCMEETRAVLSHVRTRRVVIFQGRRDHEVPAHRAPQIIEELGAISKELVWLNRSFHEIPRDYDAEIVIDRINAELEALEAGRS